MRYRLPAMGSVWKCTTDKLLYRVIGIWPYRKRSPKTGTAVQKHVVDLAPYHSAVPVRIPAEHFHLAFVRSARRPPPSNDMSRHRFYRRKR